jgi:hypothetical protein
VKQQYKNPNHSPPYPQITISSSIMQVIISVQKASPSSPNETSSLSSEEFLNLVFSQFETFPDPFNKKTPPPPSMSMSPPQSPTELESSARFYGCESCAKTFVTSYALKSHATCHTKARPFKCQTQGCKSQFKRSWDWKRHALKCYDGIQ